MSCCNDVIETCWIATKSICVFGTKTYLQSRGRRLLQISILALPVLGVNLPFSQVHRRLVLGCAWYRLHHFLHMTAVSWRPPIIKDTNCCDISREKKAALTSLSNTHVFSFRSARLHCHSCWLFCSRQFQCLRNSSRHALLMSSSLPLLSYVSGSPYRSHERSH